MKLRRSLIFTLVLAAIAVFIHLYSINSTRVENEYAAAIYPAFSRILRYLFGWLPFSMGDILYGLVILWLICKVVALFIPQRGDKEKLLTKIRRKFTLHNFATKGLKGLRILLITYILFNGFWGINYNRIGIASQLHLKLDKYSLQDLKILNGLLLQKTNAAKEDLVKANISYPSNNQLFLKVQDAYQQAQKVYPFLNYQPVSLKPSLWSWVGNYMGFTGYYNPFTGEAQVNTLVPKFLQPFTSCHEVAHQLGYAKEMEANFVAYLSASASQDTLLHYSVYLDLFIYSNRNLFETDSTAAMEFRQQLIPEVITDLKEWRAFNKKYRNPIEPVFRWVYGVYLKQNQQPQGVLSYDEVTAFMIAYYKKYGKI